MDCKQMKIGHHSQLNAVEEMRLCGGRGDGTRLVQAKNEEGIHATVCADRCLDLYRFEYKGKKIISQNKKARHDFFILETMLFFIF